MAKLTGILLIATAAALAALTPATASAATISPTPGFLSDDFANNANCSLREAVQVANTDSEASENSCAIAGTLGDPDTIELGAGTYELSIDGLGQNQAGDLFVANDSLTIDGAGAASTTIRGQLNSWTERILTAQQSGKSLTISDLTIAGGRPTNQGGGGIRIDSSSMRLTLERVRVNDNRATQGAGVMHLGGDLDVRDSVFSGNRAVSTGVASGGGLFASPAGTVTIARSVLSGNTSEGPTASSAGLATGINATGISIVDSVIADNTAIDTTECVVCEPFTPTAAGASLFVDATDTAIVRNTTISGNRGEDPDGDLAGSAGGLRIQVASETADASVINSTISGNGAAEAGGADKLGAGPASFVHTSLGANTAASGGSALRVAGPASIAGSIIDDAPGGATACFEDGGAISSLGGNVGRDASCELSAAGDAPSINPLLGALTDNGGPDAGAPGSLAPIRTHLPAGTSAALDRVPAADCDDVPAGPLLLDQRGLPRPDDGDGDGLGECEAGSVELQIGGVPSPPPPPPPSPSSPAAPSDVENPECDDLRRKLRKAKRKDQKRKVKKLRRKLRRLGC